MESVTVITKDAAYADFMSTDLFLLPVEDGLKLVNETDDLEAIWYVSENEIVTSKGINDIANSTYCSFSGLEKLEKVEEKFIHKVAKAIKKIFA